MGIIFAHRCPAGGVCGSTSEQVQAGTAAKLLVVTTSVTQARTQLGEEVYASAWSEGYAMSPEQAIALAFEE